MYAELLKLKLDVYKIETFADRHTKHWSIAIPSVLFIISRFDALENKSYLVQFQPQFILKLFLILEEFEPHCSYKISIR